ncbi:MAG: glycosyltransferase family 2 protein [Marmoricola sp.]
MTTTPPPVSVFMTVLNEEAELADAVHRVFAQDYAGEFELVLAVGPSKDDTWGVATRLAEAEPRLTVVANATGFTPHGLNAAIAAAHHDILVRVDGHAFLPQGYLATVVALLESSGADNVGGRMVPEGDGPVSDAVAVAMSSPYGIGGGAFHVGGTPGPQPTVYLGSFRRAAVEAVGGYDEHFLRAQDWELNHRLREAGFVVWFDPALAVSYRPRSSWRAFARQQFRTGGWRRRVIETHRSTASVRYLAPPVAVLGVLLGLLAGALAPVLGGWLLLGLVAPLGYLGAVTLLGLREGRQLPWRARWRVPIAFAVLHLAWGSGFLLRAR